MYEAIDRWFADNSPASPARAASELGLPVRVVRDYIALQMANKRLEDIEGEDA